MLLPEQFSPDFKVHDLPPKGALVLKRVRIHIWEQVPSLSIQCGLFGFCNKLETLLIFWLVHL